MTHTKNFEKIKYYYDHKLWSKERVYKAVTAKINPITPEEYEEITGETYND